MKQKIIRQFGYRRHPKKKSKHINIKPPLSTVTVTRKERKKRDLYQDINHIVLINYYLEVNYSLKQSIIRSMEHMLVRNGR